MLHLLSAASSLARGSGRLALRNKISMIALLVWGVLLLGWMIYNFVLYLKLTKRGVIESGAEISFTCGHCGAPFRLPAAYLAAHPLLPKKSVSVTVLGSGGTVSLSRRVRCPCCKTRCWCRQEPGEARRVSLSSSGDALRKILPRFLLVTAGLFLLMGGLEGALTLFFR